MEGINGVWMVAFLITLVVGGGLLLLTLVAGVLWLVRQSQGSLEFFAASLGGVAVAGAVLVLSLVFADPRELGLSTPGLWMLATASSILLAGVGQYVVARRSPRNYALVLPCALAPILIGVGVPVRLWNLGLPFETLCCLIPAMACLAFAFMLQD